MNPLQLRKRLLVVESELQRAAMQQDLAALRTSVRSITARTAALAALVAAAAGLAETVVRRKRQPPARPAGWLRTALSGLELLLPLWQAWRAKAPGTAPGSASAPPPGASLQ